MADADDQPSRYRYLTFNAPLSGGRADAIATRLAATSPGTVLDIGCGWGELLLRVVERTGAASGLGVDTDDRVLARGREAAERCGLGGRVSFLNSAGTDTAGPADVVICNGAAHAFGGAAQALAALYRLVRPGGRLLYGDAIRDTAAAFDSALVWDDFAELPSLGDLVDTAVAAGFRPLRIETSNTDELDAFESGYLADLEEWLMTHQDHPDAGGVRARAEEHRQRWLHGYRGAFGYAYLTLGVPFPGGSSVDLP